MAQGTTITVTTIETPTPPMIARARGV